MTSTSERLQKIMNDKGLNAKQFSEAIGLKKPQAIYDILHGKTKCISEKMTSKIISVFPDINKTWLVIGDGGDAEKPVMIPNDSGIPLIPTNAIGGALTGIADSFMEYECEKYIVPQFSGADFLIRVQGDSMTPKYIPGDIVACKRIKDRIWFQWGKAYVVDTRQGVLVKRIEPSDQEGCISLHSENAKYKPFDLPADELNGVAIVIGVIRVE